VHSGVIAGTVVDQKTGLPISHASVVLERATQRVAMTPTDVTGRHRFAAAAPGLYRVEIGAGYASSVR
jgi:protocatechuate 3,4-dioxygenase beta subunit